MALTSGTNLSLSAITKHSDVFLAAGVIAILAIIIVPLPTPILDVLLALNITFALIILMVAVYTTEPLQFSVFPGLLLLVTLFRLSLNIASTRLILGESYAGDVISSFGTFVVGGNYVVGFVIFLILVIIQFVVITKGSSRIAEVAARFTLDAMPGKQMSIDADLNAGLIDDVQARDRREKIAREADFYGAMDGASKFVRGDAIAGLIITIINIIGGLIIGVVQMGMSFGQAAQTYSILTVGDGLVAQIPAIIISTAAGIIVTRAASESNLGQDVTRQILLQPKAIYIASSVLFMLGVTPGLPTVPFFFLSAVTGAIAYMSTKVSPMALEMEELEAAEEVPKEEERIEEYLKVDPVELEIGYGLIKLVDASQGGDLLDRITIIRKQVALQLGIIVPPIRIRDNIQLKSNEYVIKLRGIDVARSEIMRGNYLAMNPGTAEEEIEGIETTEPAFGTPALWITAAQKERAEIAGYTVVEAPAVLAAHLMEVLKNRAHKILTRHDVQKLIENVKEEYPTVVEELIPDVSTVGSIHKVLLNLLREGVPIRDLVAILETLADYAPMTKDIAILTEYVRNTLSHTISGQLQDEEGKIVSIILSQQVEQIIADGIREADATKSSFSLPPEVVREIYADLARRIEEITAVGRQPVVVCSPTVRYHFRQLVEAAFPHLTVISYSEIPQDVELESIGTVGISGQIGIPDES